MIIYEAEKSLFQIFLTDKMDATANHFGQDYVNVLAIGHFNLADVLYCGSESLKETYKRSSSVSEAYIGFTAATGGISQEHNVIDPKFFQLT
jgi:hypothetical protein